MHIGYGIKDWSLLIENSTYCQEIRQETLFSEQVYVTLPFTMSHNEEEYYMSWADSWNKQMFPDK